MENLQFLKSYYDNGDPSHDWSHIKRVVKMCRNFGEELGANLRILLPAAYLHDIVNVPKDRIHRAKASELAANKASLILEDLDFSDEEVSKIAQVIIEHSYSANIKASSIESQILQDADKLDGMGAIGIMRWATVGARMGAAYYHQEDPLAKNRELDDKAFSLDHFETKLLGLYERLNTDLGKKEGAIRLRYFQDFLKRLHCEIL